MSDISGDQRREHRLHTSCHHYHNFRHTAGSFCQLHSAAPLILRRFFCDFIIISLPAPPRPPAATPLLSLFSRSGFFAPSVFVSCSYVKLPFAADPFPLLPGALSSLAAFRPVSPFPNRRFLTPHYPEVGVFVSCSEASVNSRVVELTLSLRKIPRKLGPSIMWRPA